MRGIVCVSGSIASGKTTVSRALAHQWPHAESRSFGDVVRARARLDGRPLDRPTLQDIGAQLVAEGWSAFVAALTAGTHPDTALLVVDGIRHPAAVEALQARFPEALTRTVYLRADEQVAAARMLERGEPTHTRSHAVESELRDVERHADLVISSALPVATIVRIIDALVAG